MPDRRMKLPFTIGGKKIKIARSVTGKVFHLLREGVDCARFWKSGVVWFLHIDGTVRKFRTLTDLLLWVDDRL